jgi:hypothetical protein
VDEGERREWAPAPHRDGGERLREGRLATRHPDTQRRPSCGRTCEASAVSTWGRSVYGDPCRECGFEWSISQDDAVALIHAAPARYADTLVGRDGMERHPDLDWSAGAYVCHVTDNLRIWAERLAGFALGATGQVANYDDDLLARARAYDEVPIQASLWSLQRAAKDWTEAFSLAVDKGVVLLHPERGEQSTLDVARSNAYDVHHHAWDIRRSLN